MDKYSIGDFAKKVGVTPDFLKYYEKQGILHPHKSSSGYRYYDSSHIPIINECIKFKNWGFSAKDIEKFLHKTTYEETISYLENRRLELVHQIEFLKDLVIYSEDISSSLSNYSNNNQWNIKIKEGFYYLTQSTNFQLRLHIEDIIKNWVKYLPLVCTTARVTYPPKSPTIDWGFSVPLHIAEKLNIITDSPVEWIPPQRYLEFFDRRILDKNPTNTDFEYIRRKMFLNVDKVIEKYHLNVVGPAYFMVQTKIIEEGKRYTYQKICIPIE